jgi:hypothetical protein
LEKETVRSFASNRLRARHRNVEEFKIMKTFLSIGCGPGMGLATAERFARTVEVKYAA